MRPATLRPCTGHRPPSASCRYDRTMSIIQQFTSLIHENSFLAGPLCFVVAFFGCLLGTNLIVPAGAILTALGVLKGAGVLSWTIIPWAACGASVGMSGSYTIGLHLGSRVRQLPMLRARPELLLRARLLFEKFGWASILIAYFSGPLRAPVASVAAIAGMRRRQFELSNIMSALIWSLFAVGLGAIAGAAIPPNSIWLLIAPFLVPVITIGISLAILFLRSGLRC